MNVRFVEKDCEKAEVYINYKPFEKIKRRKQEIADFLMGKDDDNITIYNTPINERQLLLSYLPFIRSISFEGPDLDLGENEIEITFERSSLSRPTPIVIEVSPELYNFLYKKE